jgi:prepilin-type N-terminal cleavage/methylation domain-containing protein
MPGPDRAVISASPVARGPRRARPRRSARRRGPRRGFTLLELIVASMIGAMVLGSLSVGIGRIADARNQAKARLDAYMRADAALAQIRREIVTVIRSDDLFDTRVLLYDGGDEEVPRDEMLVFNTRLKVSRADNRFESDGQEWETAFRVEEDDLGPALWFRRDAVPDEFSEGGGIVEPAVEGIVGVSLLAWDGFEWADEWDSDRRGLPLAVRVEVIASGHRRNENPFDAPLVTLRTSVAIDRVAPPRDIYEQIEIELDEQEAAEAEANGEGGGGPGAGLGAGPDDFSIPGAGGNGAGGAGGVGGPAGGGNARPGGPGGGGRPGGGPTGPGSGRPPGGGGGDGTGSGRPGFGSGNPGNAPPSTGSGGGGT